MPKLIIPEGNPSGMKNWRLAMTETNPIKMLRIKEIMTRLGSSRQTIYNKIKKGLFVSPVHIGEHSSRWPSNEVDKILAAHIAGRDDEFIMTLIKQLIKERQDGIKKLLEK